MRFFFVRPLISQLFCVAGMLLTLLQAGQSLLLLDVVPMVLMWLYGIHWLHLQPLELPLFAMKVSSLPSFPPI